MNKKNIGAALSVVAAVSAGATVYASTINNLESDRNTNSMIKPYYSDTSYDYYSLVKSDYTNDLKNTAISNEKRVVQNTNDTFKETLKVEKAAKEIVATTINVEKPVKEEPVKEETEVVEVVEEVNYQEPSYEEVANLEDEENLVSEAEKYIEESEAAPAVEEASEEAEIVVYDDTNLDEVLVNEEENTPVVKEEKVASQVEYLDNNEETDQSAEAIEETRYINVDALNIRSSKSMDDASNIVRTLSRGEAVSGVVEGDWFKTNEGYLSLYYLSTEKPAPIVDESPVVEEETVVEEEAPVEEDPIVETSPVEEVAEEKGEAYTGYVYNTKTLNIRTAAKTGEIIGVLNTGDEVNGELIDGWVKFDYNGSVAYVSGYYLTSEKPVIEETVEKIKEEVAPIVEEVLYEEDIEVIEEAAEAVVEVEEAAPVVNQNGQAAASIASRFAGHPYVWGSSNPAVGFDCSGLVVNAYRELGINLPHQSAAQYNSGYAVDASNLQPGDLVFFKMRSGNIDHVGIITSSDGTFIHASTPSTGVVFDNVYDNHYQKSFVGARRIF